MKCFDKLVNHNWNYCFQVYSKTFVMKYFIVWFLSAATLLPTQLYRTGSFNGVIMHYSMPFVLLRHQKRLVKCILSRHVLINPFDPLCNISMNKCKLFYKYHDNVFYDKAFIILKKKFTRNIGLMLQSYFIQSLIRWNDIMVDAIQIVQILVNAKSHK